MIEKEKQEIKKIINSIFNPLIEIKSKFITFKIEKVEKINNEIFVELLLKEKRLLLKFVKENNNFNIYLTTDFKNKNFVLLGIYSFGLGENDDLENFQFLGGGFAIIIKILFL